MKTYTTTEQGILQLIATSSYITANKLASQLRTSKREIDKSITNLRTSGVLIASRPGRGGGYIAVDSTSDTAYINCKKWVRNWRASNGIIPLNSPLL